MQRSLVDTNLTRVGIVAVPGTTLKLSSNVLLQNCVHGPETEIKMFLFLLSEFTGLFLYSQEVLRTRSSNCDFQPHVTRRGFIIDVCYDNSGSCLL